MGRLGPWKIWRCRWIWRRRSTSQGGEAFVNLLEGTCSETKCFDHRINRCSREKRLFPGVAILGFEIGRHASTKTIADRHIGIDLQLFASKICPSTAHANGHGFEWRIPVLLIGHRAWPRHRTWIVSGRAACAPDEMRILVATCHSYATLAQAERAAENFRTALEALFA